MKNAIVVGGTSGIGRELVKVLVSDGYVVGVTARRTDLLEQMKDEFGERLFIQSLDVSYENASAQLQHLIDLMGVVELVIISAGTGFIDDTLPWSKEKETIETNVLGFTAMVNVAWHHFRGQSSGQLVGISSIAAIRGGDAPAYNASKAFVSNYLQGLRYLAAKANLSITITDIQPGFVDTRMAQGEGLFWVASAEKAATQIYQAIQKKKKHAYISKRWRLIGCLLKCLPDMIYHKL